MKGLVVHSIEDGGPIVRGTPDVRTAREAVFEWAQRRPMELSELEARSYSDFLRVMRTGWFRWNPCSPLSCFSGGTHIGHLDIASGSGYGNWQGVEFQ